MDSLKLTGMEILVVDDEPLLRRQICSHLTRLEAEVTGVGTLAQAKAAASENDCDFVLLDVNLPDGLGTDLLRQKVFSPSTIVIVMTAAGAISGAVEAMRLGAADYLTKPFDLEELPLVMIRAQRFRQSARREEYQRQKAADTHDSFFFGASMAPLAGMIDKIVAADHRIQSPLPPVLIQGETGTGKTTLARRLHHLGPRAAQPLVEVNCSALPDTLAESELFGNERGAFTDARTARVGLFEAANGGTLFLDELPSLSPVVQAKVLKVIEEQRLRRLGGTREIPVNVRIIAATHRDLKQAVAAGHFREDLLHRLDLYRLAIPPLRERGRDILQLAENLLKQLCLRHQMADRTISSQGKQRLLLYAWPGNVRELAHELERSVVFEEGSELHFENLNTPLPEPQNPGSATWLRADFSFPEQGFVLEEAIGLLVHKAVKQTDGNISAAARILGVSRDYLRYRLSAAKNKVDS